MSLKETNPKDALGITKTPFSCVPSNVIAEIALGLFEGARKYGKHNYRVIGVRYSVYHDAALRHLSQFLEGEDVDPDSGLNHITKALSCLVVLRDAMLNDMWTDDRPPKVKNQNWIKDCNDKVKEIIDKYSNPVEPYTQKSLEDIKEDKASCSFKIFEEMIADDSYKASYRYGQFIMSILSKVWQDEYNRIVNTMLDCFYSDYKIPYTLEHLKQVWKT